MAMENSKILTQEKLSDEQENFYLPEFFQQEFPNLAKFLNEYLFINSNSKNHYHKNID